MIEVGIFLFVMFLVSMISTLSTFLLLIATNILPIVEGSRKLVIFKFVGMLFLFTFMLVILYTSGRLG